MARPEADFTKQTHGWGENHKRLNGVNQIRKIVDKSPTISVETIHIKAGSIDFPA